ncbi:Uu.00g030800.m01.CDS01 [Anthostomella pinea]|uniref:Uu.00g030800.m01.CDS01 n=1 Tax=Anthostomella pinea TaxID=933095 RepID=A0AAI8V8V5_9PEZI|nr:Uu.00g030800.m01.CDS01 [Anthostomella pinea]
MDPAFAGLPPDDDKGVGLVVTAWALGAAGTILLSMRMYTRAFIVRKIGRDDWTMVLSVILALITNIVVTLMVHYGVGRHTVFLTEEQRVRAVFYIWLSVPFSPGSAAVGKISIAFLLMRLMNRDRRREAFLWTLIALLIIVNMLLIIITFAECRPVTFLWDRVGTVAHGTCWSPTVQQDYGYFQGAFSAFSDLVLALFPITILWNLQLPFRSKLVIGFLMSLGVVATVAAAVKTVELNNLATMDFTWDAVELVYWFLAENWIIIICACVPTIKPLIVTNWENFTRVASYVFGKSLASTIDTKDDQPSQFTGNSNQQYSYSLESYQPLRGTSRGTDRDSLRLLQHGQQDRDAGQHGSNPAVPGIMKTTEISVV